MIEKIRSLTKTRIFKDVAKLSFGTFLGRLVVFAVMPIMTRMYSPEDFTTLAAYISIVSTIAVVAALRLEIAIPITESDRDAAALLVISFFFISLVCTMLIVAVCFFPEHISALLDVPGIYSYLWLVPIGVMLLSSYSVMQYWSTRFHRFGLIARTRVSQALVGAGIMVASGWCGLGPLGLLIGRSLTEGAGSGLLVRQAIQKDREFFVNLRLSNLISVLKINSAYPRYSTIESFANTAGFQLPILMIASQAGSEAGQLFLAMQVVFIPMTLIGGAVSQVYLSRAPHQMRDNSLASFTYKMMKRLAILGVPTLMVIGASAPAIFSIVFGPEWARAGEIVRLLIPWVALQFIVSPVSMALHVTGNQRFAMWLQCIGLLIRFGGLLLFVYMGWGEVVEVYAALSAMFYLLYMFAVMSVMGGKAVIH